MKTYLIIALVSLLQACALSPEFRLNVDSISAPEATSKTRYVLLPGVKDVEISDLQYREYSMYVERALALKGFTKASSFDDAQIAIFLGYGIGDPVTSQFTYSLPTYGKTGVSSAQTYGTVNTFGNTATYSGTTTYTPSYGVTGSTTHTGTQITYFRYMLLNALDLDEYRNTEKVIQIWKTTVTSTGSSGDLRQVFPILVAASKPHIGSNTGKNLEVNLSETDKRVTEIKGFDQ